MSRTDKDRPWQLLAADRWPGSYWSHGCDGGRYSWSRECDVDEDPVEVFKHAFDGPGTRWRVYRSPNCGWSMPHCSFKHPPKWFVDHVWHNPERVRVRDGLRSMAREYNASGSIEDDDFANLQARSVHVQWC